MVALAGPEDSLPESEPILFVFENVVIVLELVWSASTDHVITTARALVFIEGGVSLLQSSRLMLS